MKYLTIIAIALSIWLPAQANTHLEKAYASLSVAVGDATEEVAIRQSAYNAALQKAADVKKEMHAAKAEADKRAAVATQQAEVMKAAIAKIAGIRKMALAAHEKLKTMGPIAPNSDLARAHAALVTSVDNTRKTTAALQTAYNAAVERAEFMMKVAETTKFTGNRKIAAAVKQADSLKAAATRATDVQNKSLAALESLKLALETSSSVVIVKGKNYRMPVL